MPRFAPFASPHARAVLSAQFRIMRNRLPRTNKFSLLFTAVVGALWYGLIVMVAVAIGVVLSNASQIDSIGRILPGGLLLMFLYWVVIPILLASKGASLELRKLMVYPIPHAEFFRLEMLLRLSVGIEPLIATCGAFVGLLFNRAVPLWAPFALVLFVLFTMFFAAGIHELLGRLMMRKGIREVAGLLFIMTVLLPQLIIARGNMAQFRTVTGITGWMGWPWTSTAQVALGHAGAANVSVLLAWTAAAYIFGRRQFERTLRFDAAERSARRSTSKNASRVEWFFRWPNLLFKDPVAAIVEKEIRFLARAARFRMVFFMGFSFGLILWWPMAFGSRQSSVSFMSQNFISVVSLYAVLLLSDVLFWNAFGFDRSAVQIYFIVPVSAKTVLLGKNLAAAFFVFLETTIAIAICAIVQLPVTIPGVAEAYMVTLVAIILLLSIGNLTSLYSPRPVDPAKALRPSRGGRVQALMLVVYPVVALPLLMAYGARYAFDSEAAFFGVLAVAVLFGLIVYRIAMESAVGMAESRKEAIVASLSRGEGPVE